MVLSLHEATAIARKPQPAGDLVDRYGHLLSSREEALLRCVYQDGHSAAFAAKLLGVPPRKAQRQVKRLLRRMGTDEFRSTAKALGYLDTEDAELARLRFCQGLALREVGRRLGRPLHAVRRRVDRLKVKIRAIVSLPHPEQLLASAHSGFARQFNPRAAGVGRASPARRGGPGGGPSRRRGRDASWASGGAEQRPAGEGSADACAEG